MAKAIKNKQYNEFWEDEKLDVQKVEKPTEATVPSDEIKKLEKKITKKVLGLEKELKELKETKEEPVVEEVIEPTIKPINTPRGWHAKNSFVDDIGNEFCKGVYIGKSKVEEPKKEVKSSKKEEVKPQPKPKIEEIPVLITPPVRKVLTDKDIYQQYITDNIPFKMFFRGNLIFDSKVQPPKNYPIFQDDGFILFGKNYIYRGIRIEKY